MHAPKACLLDLGSTIPRATRAGSIAKKETLPIKEKGAAMQV